MTKEMHWRAMIPTSPTRAKPKVAVQTGAGASWHRHRTPHPPPARRGGGGQRRGGGGSRRGGGVASGSAIIGRSQSFVAVSRCARRGEKCNAFVVPEGSRR